MPAMFAIPAEPALGDVSERTVAASQTFKRGAIVLLDGSEDVIEASADPASIYGFAAMEWPEGGAAAPADFTLIPIFKATEGQKFWMSGDNAPVKADINQSYGVVADGDGIWTVDGTDVTNTRVYVHDIDLERNLYKVSVLVANRQAV